MEADLRLEVEARLEAAEARVETELVRSNMETNSGFEHVRLDIQRLDAAVARLDAKIDAFAERLDARIDAATARLETRIDAKCESVKSELIKWIVGMGVASMTILISLLTFLLGHR